MKWWERILYSLQGTMETPVSFGWFHWMWIGLIIISVIILYEMRRHFNEKQLKIVLGIYGIIAFLLEVGKQLIWSFNYDPLTKIVVWDYEWYAFPFQLCTTPILVSLICLFLKPSKIRKSLLSYMAFITILGSIATVIMPDSCFVSDTLVNIHTMWLHCGSLVVSIYLLMSGEVELKINNLIRSIITFLIFVGIANLLNVVIYNTGILNGETFNMFYISPYFISTLPVFDVIQENVSYIVYLVTYLSIIITGSFVIYYSSLGIKYIFYKYKLDD